MAIGIIGWGSLIWDPGELKLGSRWFLDGPVLPLEFARISKRDRLTLVVSNLGSLQRTYWAQAISLNLQAVLSQLQAREGTSRIDFADSDGATSTRCPVEIRDQMIDWLGKHPQLQACAWTGLRTNWNKKREREFSFTDALAYPTGLPDPSSAREYIENAPAQIQTPLRHVIREELGWNDAQLPDDLFSQEGQNSLPISHSEAATRSQWIARSC